MVNKEVRRESRILAVEALFAYFSRNGSIEPQEAFDHVLYEVAEKEQDLFAQKLLDVAIEHFKKIKVIVRAFAPEFAFEKIAPINRALLILGIAEMKFIDTPPIVVINEYVELSKLLGEQRSASFINGVLDNFRKNIGRERGEDLLS